MFLGVGTDTNTFLHAAEALLESEWEQLYPGMGAPLSGLTREEHDISTRLSDGSVHVCRTRLFDREAMIRRDGTKVERWLAERGKFRATRVKGLSIKVLRADEVFEEMRRRGRVGEFVLDAAAYLSHSGASS